MTSTVSPRWGLVRFNETLIEVFSGAPCAMDGAHWASRATRKIIVEMAFIDEKELLIDNHLNQRCSEAKFVRRSWSFVI